MRPVQSLTHLTVCLSTFGSLVSASSWPRGLLSEKDALVARQDNTNANAVTRTAADSSQGTAATLAAQTGSTSQPKAVGANTANPTVTGKGTATKNNDIQTTEFPPQDPVGGISMLTPNPAVSPTGLYSHGQIVTLAFNATDVQAPPRSVDCLLVCPSAANAIFPLAVNMSYSQQMTVVWNSSKQANDPNQPLLTACCQLDVIPSGSDLNQVPKPGYLYGMNVYPICLYKSQDYLPWDQWNGPGKNAASSIVAQQVVGLAVVMSGLAAASLTWFV